MTLRRFLFGIAVLSFSVLTSVADTQAKDQSEYQRVQRTRGNSFLRKAPLRPTSTTGSRVHAVALSKREIGKLIKAASKRCGCTAAPQDTEFSKSCFKNCLANYVGASTVLACGTVCFGGNAAGCAFCLGAHEWVVLGCLQYCVWRDVLSYVEEGVSSNRGRPSNRRQGKPLMRSPVTASSS